MPEMPFPMITMFAIQLWVATLCTALGRGSYMELTNWIHTTILTLGIAVVCQSTYAQKIQGVCFSAPPEEVGDTCMKHVLTIGAEWVCLMPYAYGPNEHGRLQFDPDGDQWWGERPVGIRAMIRMAKEHGMKVMLKPHIWLGHGEFTGTFVPPKELGWGPFEESYSEYVMYFARIAQEMDVELYCIGTEMEQFVTQRQNYWQILIDRISEAYSGQLTYAANWDEVERFPLWKRMAFVGVDAYFPLCEIPGPTAIQLQKGWEPHVEMLEALSKRMERPVLLTEMGYTNTATCAKEPWMEDENAELSEGAQALAYEAFFDTFSTKPWYAGCFIWKWFAKGGVRESRNNIGFSPQGKMAIKVLDKRFRWVE